MVGMCLALRLPTPSSLRDDEHGFFGLEFFFFRDTRSKVSALWSLFCGLVSLTLVDSYCFPRARFVPTAAVKSATGPCRALLIGSRPFQLPGLLGISFGLVVVDFSHNLPYLDPSRCR